MEESAFKQEIGNLIENNVKKIVDDTENINLGLNEDSKENSLTSTPDTKNKRKKSLKDEFELIKKASM